MSRCEILTWIAIAVIAGVISGLILKLLSFLVKYLKRWRQRRKEAKAEEFYLPRERCYTKEERKAIEQRTKEIAAELKAQFEKEI